MFKYKIIKSIVVSLALMSILSACGSTSSLKSAKNGTSETAQKVDLTGYDVVFVKDFEDATNSGKHEVVKGVGASFADMIAGNLRATHAFKKVTREAPTKEKALLIQGRITQYDDGNPVLRMTIGFAAGNANFDADVELFDNQTLEPLGNINVDKNSWALGGYIAASQTASSLMGDSVKKIVKEISSAKLEGDKIKGDFTPAAYEQN